MKGLSIKVKTIILSSAILMLLLGLGGLGVYSVEHLGKSVNVLSQHSLPAVRYMTLIDMMHDGASATVYKSLVIGPSGKAEIEAEFKEIFDNMNSYLGELDKLEKNSDLEKAVVEARKAIELYQVEGKKVLDAALAGDKVLAESHLPQFNKSFEYLEKELQVIGEGIEKDAQGFSAASLKESSELKEWMLYFVGIAIVIACFVSFLAYRFIAGLTFNLLGITKGLKQEAQLIVDTSVSMAQVAGKLSEASTEQAASLQETVASIDEISAMITRNADTAGASAKMSEQSTLFAQKGKEKSEQMLESINAIATGNDEIIRQMQQSNSEISEIVKVIQDIGQKTQVINDIVFQTKLLSFNASVEAARAGEHGKGFAVVAEEVGNLASMSGKAAAEITEMLSKSVKRVTEIVDGTKHLMDNLINQSKEKIDSGASTVKECSHALDDILSNVSTMNEMVREISTASQEQAAGVREVNKAMSELDEVTQSNSNVAQESSKAANNLQSQADRLNQLVFQLTGLLGGEEVKAKAKAKPAPQPAKVATAPVNNVVPLKPFKPKASIAAAAPERKLKKAVGVEFEAPKSDDPRFEDV